MITHLDLRHPRFASLAGSTSTSVCPDYLYALADQETPAYDPAYYRIGEACSGRDGLARTHLVCAKGWHHVSANSLSPNQALALLAQTPPNIAALTAGLSASQLQSIPAPGEWSANDVLAHLRACADVWGDCMVRIITQDRPALRAISPRTWIRKTDYLEQEFQPSLQAFTTQRTALLAHVEPLSHAGWSRTATITGAGKVLAWIVLFYAERMARHERQHVRQIEHIVSMMGVEH